VTTLPMLYIIHPKKIANLAKHANAEQFFPNDPPNAHNIRVKSFIEWKKPEPADYERGVRMLIEFKGDLCLEFVTWHHKGDYIATVCPEGNRSAVFIHQLSKMQTQNPFTKNKGRISCVRFHPTRPHFFVVGQKNIRIYNLSEQQLIKKLIPGVTFISSLHIHPGGDNVIMGAYDKRVCWFDLDYGSKPYKTLRYHRYAVRSVRFHPRYPLFATCSDDSTIHVFHGMVYDDLLKNAFIVPLKVLRGHKITDDIGVMDIIFHPFQPWIFSAGSDATIRLWV